MVSYVALFRKTQVVNSEAVATDPPNVELLKEAVLVVSGNSSAFQLDPESLNVAGKVICRSFRGKEVPRQKQWVYLLSSATLRRKILRQKF